jgi:protein TonB
MNPGLATTHDVQPRPDGTILGQPYFDLQVEKQAAPMPGNPSPHYPDMLRSANVEGEVLAKFIVDSTGRVEPNTFKARLHGHGAGSRALSGQDREQSIESESQAPPRQV